MFRGLLRLIWRFVHAFRANNNVRLLTLWAVTVVWLFGHLWLFGLGPETRAEIPESTQQFHNYVTNGDWTTDAERSGLLSNTAGSVWEWISDSSRTVSWWALLVLLFASIVYFPIAMWDELKDAWQIAERRFREKGSRFTDLPDAESGEAPPGQGGEEPLTWKKYMRFELLTDFLWEAVAHIPQFLFHRR